MPYIKRDRREPIDEAVDVALAAIENVGDLNYAITKLCNLYLDDTDRNYAAYNSVVGVLECAKLEFYRRAVAAYEDQKIKDNGDVY